MVFIKNTWSGASYMPATNTKFSKFSASVIYADRHICRLPPVPVNPATLYDHVVKLFLPHSGGFLLFVKLAS